MDTSKKLSDSDKQLLYILLSIVLVAAAFFFGFSPMKNKASEIKTENERLEQQIKGLQTMQLQTSNKKKLIKMFDETTKLMNLYLPSSITEEKIIFIVNEMEKETKMNWSTLNMQLNQQIVVGNDKTITFTPIDEKTKLQEGAGLVSSISIAYDNLSYENLKKAVEFLEKQPDRITISDIDASYDNETDKLQGTMKINFYCMYQNKKNEYKAPEINNADVPVDGTKQNIFGAYGSH